MIVISDGLVSGPDEQLFTVGVGSSADAVGMPKLAATEVAASRGPTAQLQIFIISILQISTGRRAHIGGLV
jgi:hypothetical protein